MDQLDSTTRNLFFTCFQNILDSIQFFQNHDESFKTIFIRLDLVGGLLDELKIATKYSLAASSSSFLASEPDPETRDFILTNAKLLSSKIATKINLHLKMLKSDILVKLKDKISVLASFQTKLTASLHKNLKFESFDQVFYHKSSNFYSPNEYLLIVLEFIENLKKFCGKFDLVISLVEEDLKKNLVECQDSDDVVNLELVSEKYTSENLSGFETEKFLENLLQVSFVVEDLVVKLS